MNQISDFEDGLKVYYPSIFNDDRGCFFESVKDTIIETKQVNVSISKSNVFRGLHYQSKDKKQQKFVKVLKGSIIDVVLNINQNSPYFGKYYFFKLNEWNKSQLFIPDWYAHGFIALEETTLEYNVNNYYSKEEDRCINVFSVGGLTSQLEQETCDFRDWIMSDKDNNAMCFDEHKKNNFFEK